MANEKDWLACVRASNRLADLVCAMYHPRDEKARKTWPTATWAELIASELGIEVPDSNGFKCSHCGAHQETRDDEENDVCDRCRGRIAAGLF